MSTTSPLPKSLPHTLERTVIIHATPDTVFRFFTDSTRFAKWWGAGSTIDPKPGGRVFITHPGNIESGGEVVEIDPPRRLVFTYGFVSGKPIPVGSSRVVIELGAERAGTRLRLRHELADKAAALFAEYRLQLEKTNRLDFPCLLSKAIELLESKPAVARLLRTAYRPVRLRYCSYSQAVVRTKR